MYTGKRHTSRKDDCSLQRKKSIQELTAAIGAFSANRKHFSGLEEADIRNATVAFLISATSKPETEGTTSEASYMD